MKNPLPANATAEQIAAWRTENGIPATGDGYIASLPAEIKIEPHNKEMASFIANRMLAVNASPAVVHEGLKVMNEWQAQLIEKRVEADETLRASTEDALRAEWGNEYRANRNNVLSFLSATAPPEVADALLNARTPDGTPFVGTPAAVRWLASMAKLHNPFGTIVPGAGAGTGMGNVDSRINQINAMMSDQSSEYWKGPNAEKIQKEYRDLIDAQNRQKERGAAA